MRTFSANRSNDVIGRKYGDYCVAVAGRQNRRDEADRVLARASGTFFLTDALRHQERERV